MGEKVTLGKFSAGNMNNCGHNNVRRHREIKGSDKYVTLEISLKFSSMDKMRITSSEPEDNLVILGKGLITSLCLNAIARAKKYKKARYAIGNVSKKDLSNNIREFDRLPYTSYERRRSKHDPTYSYSYLAIQLAKCMMRADALNSHVYPVIIEITGAKQIPISHVFPTDES